MFKVVVMGGSPVFFSKLVQTFCNRALESNGFSKII